MAVDWQQDPVRLNYIVLESAARVKGLGTRIIRDVMAAVARAHKGIQLRVLRPNEAARRLYARIGFADQRFALPHALGSLEPHRASGGWWG